MLTVDVFFIVWWKLCDNVCAVDNRDYKSAFSCKLCPEVRLIKCIRIIQPQWAGVVLMAQNWRDSVVSCGDGQSGSLFCDNLKGHGPEHGSQRPSLGAWSILIQVLMVFYNIDHSLCPSYITHWFFSPFVCTCFCKHPDRQMHCLEWLGPFY